MTDITTEQQIESVADTHQDQDKKLSDYLWNLAIKLAQYHFNRQTRQALSHLDDHLLEDIGITRKQAQQELTTSFWKSKKT